MKRKKELLPLSWEHHDGLVFVFRLQQGIKNSAPVKDMREYILHTWDNALNHHFWQEEQSLNSVLEKTEKGNELLHQMLEDHEHFKKEIEYLRSEENPDTKRLLNFAERLNKHIRIEERDLFPFLEKTIEPAMLEQIGHFLIEHHEKPEKCWSETFWK